MPSSIDATFKEGLAFHQNGDSAKAEALYQEVLAIDPDHFDALHLSGVIALQAGDLKRAVEMIGKALTFEPENPNRADAYSNYSTTLRAQGSYQPALRSIDKALSFRPRWAEFHASRGNILSDLDRYAEAVSSYSKAIALEPRHRVALYYRGRALFELGEYNAALESYGRALALEPKDIDVLNSLGVALSAINRHGDALEAYDEALRLHPTHLAALRNRGHALRSLGRSEEAFAAYSQALERRSGSDIYASRADVLMDLKRPAEAVQDFNAALSLSPSYPFLAGLRLFAQMSMCEWDKVEARTADVLVKVARGERATPPWPLLTFSSTPGLQRRAAEIWAKEVANPEKYIADPRLGAFAPRAPGAKIRIGYFCSDFREHPTAFLLAGVLAAHDRKAFELYGFSYGRNTGDAMRKRFETLFDQFIDVAVLPEREIALLARQRNLDIAIDLNGYVTHARPNIFAFRAAPVQVNYLGYPGTMGTSFMDYLIADATVIPQTARENYNEKIVHMPHSYQPNGRERAPAETSPSRAALGLPEAGFVFCCFNNSFKITPPIFNSWMRMLVAVPGSVLWLMADNEAAVANLRKEAVAHGVVPERLIFAPRVGQAEHLARHRAVDLMLDTLPCTAHTTASDALWMEVPLVTCTADSFASRVAASLLKAVGLAELVTSSQNDYEALAIALALDPARLGALKEKLVQNRSRAPLFDAPAYARALESAFSQMHERRMAGLTPEHIVVS